MRRSIPCFPFLDGRLNLCYWEVVDWSWDWRKKSVASSVPDLDDPGPDTCRHWHAVLGSRRGLVTNAHKCQSLFLNCVDCGCKFEVIGSCLRTLPIASGLALAGFRISCPASFIPHKQWGHDDLQNTATRVSSLFALDRKFDSNPRLALWFKWIGPPSPGSCLAIVGSKPQTKPRKDETSELTSVMCNISQNLAYVDRSEMNLEQVQGSP